MLAEGANDFRISCFSRLGWEDDEQILNAARDIHLPKYLPIFESVRINVNVALSSQLWLAPPPLQKKPVSPHFFSVEHTSRPCPSVARKSSYQGIFILIIP